MTRAAAQTIVLACVSFLIGCLARDVWNLARDRYMTWRMNRDHLLAVERMVGCSHEQTVLTDCGMGLVTPKCLRCWALHLSSPMPGWTPNCASPAEAAKLTRELRSGKMPRPM